jgi:hypothetical protein
MSTYTHWSHLLQHRSVDHFLAALLIAQVEANRSFLRSMRLGHSVHYLRST